MFGFPKNPPDGMIFEAVPGVFFQFDKKNDCWVSVEGLSALGLATPTKDGLMSPEDLQKLNGLIIPPPQSTLKGEECKTTFTNGKVRLTSTDGSLSVSPNLQLLNKRGLLNQPWFLHENTAGYDFKLNFDQLLADLKAAGRFTQVQIQGKQGLKGNPGQPGIDRLDTGPKGDTGTAGKNSPFQGVISTEPNALQLIDDNANRAIVDIQSVSGPDGNFLVATRANIGNPGACPQEVTPKDLTSPQVLVLNKKANALVHTLEQTNDCNNPCTVCVTSLHYVNMEMLLDSIFDRFMEQLAALKAAKEELATTWLQAMITVFNEQKAALCCALENCKSTQRNASERRYIEQQRIQAAQADQQLIIDGQNDHVNINMDPDKTCAVPAVDANVRRGVGCDCVLQYTLDGKSHATDPRGLFLERPPAIVDTSFRNAFITNQGILDIHYDLQKLPDSQISGTTDDESITRNIVIQTGVKPPAESANISSWEIDLSRFSMAVNPVRTAQVNIVTVQAIIKQNGNVIGSFTGSSPLKTLADTTLKLTQDGSADFGKALDPNSPIELNLDVNANTVFTKGELTSLVSADVFIGSVNLIGTSTIATINIALQPDWTSNDWIVDNSTTSQGSGRGFVQLSLPAGSYVAEIIDCCVDTNNARHLWKGTAAIEFNTINEVTGGGGTVAPDSEFTTRSTVMFPDLGTFNNNADARVKYLGSSISFTHQGGQIRSWIVDPDSIPSNNDGQITICIRPLQCVENLTGSVPFDTGAIFVYSNTISPLTLIGVIHPFVGDIDAISNYNFNSPSAPDAANIQIEPELCKQVVLTTKSFFYNGPDGLSFFTINGGSGVNAKINVVNMSFGAFGNSAPTRLLVSDDVLEAARVMPDTYNASWSIGTGGSDGLVIGYFDQPTNGGSWALAATPTDMGSTQLWECIGSDGNRFGLALDATGIKNTFAKQQVIFTPIKAGCIMSYKQIQWLERGHRTGASCSAVVNIDGTSYVIVKRSLADDTTCGGGESLSNACIAEYVAIGSGHPAIAWPTVNGEEFLGIPTSGGHGFTFDQAFSDKVLAKLAAGDYTNPTGDPVANIPFVLVATSS